MYLNQIVECGGIPYFEFLSEPDYDPEEMKISELVAQKMNELLDKSSDELTTEEQEIVNSYYNDIFTEPRWKLKLRQIIDEEIPEDAYTADHREVGFDQVEWF